MGSLIKRIETEPFIEFLTKPYYFGEISSDSKVVNLTIGKPDYEKYGGPDTDAVLVFAGYYGRITGEDILYYRPIPSNSRTVDLKTLATIFENTLQDLGTSFNAEEFIRKANKLGMKDWDTDGV